MAPHPIAADDTAAAAGREQSQPAPASLLARGLALLERPRPEDQDESQRQLRKALKADPTLAAAHTGLARSSTYLFTLGIDGTPGRLQEALDESEKAIAQAPDDPTAHAARALALAASDRLTPALEEASRAQALGDRSVEAQVALCVVRRLRRDLDGALEACRRASDILPDSPRTLTALAETLRERGQYNDAMDLFGQAADLDHESALPQLGGAATLAKAGAFSRAARAYDLVIDGYPFARLRALQGAAGLRVAAGDYEPALGIYQRVELPDDATLPTLLSLYGKGYALLRLDRAPEAEYFLSTLVNRVPADYDGPARGREVLFDAYDDLIRFFEEHRHPERSEALLRDATRRPLAPTRFARRLAARLQRAGKADEGAGLLEKAMLASDPLEDGIEQADSMLALARLRSSNGKRPIASGSPAAEALRAVSLRLSKKDAPAAAVYRLARAKALAGDAEGSLACLDRARATGYFPAAQAAADPDFAILRGRPEFKRLLETPPEASPEARESENVSPS
jgi:tetratricopeptide (TPR) repeat protein